MLTRMDPRNARYAEQGDIVFPVALIRTVMDYARLEAIPPWELAIHRPALLALKEHTMPTQDLQRSVHV